MALAQELDLVPCSSRVTGPDAHRGEPPWEQPAGHCRGGTHCTAEDLVL